MGEADKTSETAAGTLRLPAAREAFDRLVQWLEKQLESLTLSPRISQQIAIVSDEIFTNIASYAYPDNAPGEVDVTLTSGNGEIRLIFSDSGVAYNPLTAPPPDTSSPLAERKLGGLGVFMVKKLTDFQSYERRDGRNVLTVTKKL